MVEGDSEFTAVGSLTRTGGLVRTGHMLLAQLTVLLMLLFVGRADKESGNEVGIDRVCLFTVVIVAFDRIETEDCVEESPPGALIRRSEGSVKQRSRQKGVQMMEMATESTEFYS